MLLKESGNFGSVREQYENCVMGTYGRLPAVLDCGSETTVTDENGKEYIDFASGIGTNSLGYADPEWVRAVCEQAKKLQHSSNYYYTKVQADFAERLLYITGYDKLFFANSGAEANECAIKIARKYSFDKYGKDSKRYKIITLKNGFHGRTIATLSATGQDVFHNYFFPFLEGFEYIEANNTEELERAADDSTCAVMLEFIQGEGGVNVLQPDFVKAVFDIAEKKDILVIADEVQTGVGRTGKFLLSEHYKEIPDITTLAKGIAGGLPMGVCLAGKKCSGVLTKGTHGSTFGGNPIACAGALTVLEKVTGGGFMRAVDEKGRHLMKLLNDIDGVDSLTGRGLMIGAVLKKNNAQEILEKAFERGVLVLTAKEKLRFLPPLTISVDDIEKGAEILKEVIDG